MAEPTRNVVEPSAARGADQPQCQFDQPPNGHPTWRTALPLVLVIVFSIALRAGIDSIPLDRVEGEYAYVAQRWLAGELPYRDTAAQSPPGMYVAYAMLFALGGDSIRAIHWLGHLQLVGTIIFVYCIGWRLFSHLAGWVAALFTVVLVMDYTVLGNSANAKLFGLFPLVAGMYFTLRAADNRRARDALLAGIFGGLALCIDLATIPAVLFYAASIIVLRWRSAADAEVTADAGRLVSADQRRARSSFVLAGCFTLGVGLILLPTCLYFAGHGAWRGFYESVVSPAAKSSGGAPLRSYRIYSWSLTKAFWLMFWPILGLAVFALVAAWKKRGTVAVRVCLLWWAALLLAVCVGEFHFHQDSFLIVSSATNGLFMPSSVITVVLPATALLAAYGVESLAPILEPKRTEWHTRVAAGLALLVPVWTLGAHRGYFGHLLVSRTPERITRVLYHTNPFWESVELGNLLRENSAPSDRIFICGSEPQILFFAERRSASRYSVVFPLFSGEGARSRQQSVIEEVQNVRPKFMIVVVPTFVPASYAAATGFPNDLMENLSDLIKAEYSPFVAVTLRPPGISRIIQPSAGDNGEQVFMTEQEEVVTMQVWERRDSSEYTERQTSWERHMNSWRDTLKRNLDAVRERVDRSARASGRPGDAVRLVAVTKQIDESVAAALVELGACDLGENRPQELWRKQQLVPGPVRWHLVGNLQKNKARRTLPLVHLIHSVDSVALLRRLDEIATELDSRPEVLLEVNTSGEATKHGFRPEDVSAAIAESGRLLRVQIRGLMTMAPHDDEPARARPYFAALRELRDTIAGTVPPNYPLTELSMGMSGDFEPAIAEGATIVRIGSALFEGIKEPA
jgi:hypothetical protein